MNFGGIFSLDSKFSQVMSRVFDLMILNIIFIVMCIPIVTIGANCTAMYYVTLKMVRNEDSYLFRSYWKSFKENFKQATVIWLLMLVVTLILAADAYLTTYFLSGSIRNVRYVFYSLLIMCAFTLLYVFPVLSRFYNTTKNTLINAMFYAFRHLPSTLAMLAIIILPTVLVIYTSSAMVMWYYILVCFLFIFSVTAYANSYFFHRIFNKYIPAEMLENVEDTEDTSATTAEIEAKEAESSDNEIAKEAAATVDEHAEDEDEVATDEVEEQPVEAEAVNEESHE